MTLSRLIRSNILGNPFRSLIILICAALVAALALTASFVVRGGQASLHLNLQRLGADILVVPWGTMTEKLGGVRLMSAAIDGWMPRPYVDRIAAVDGVAQVSPQLHLATMPDSPYCAAPEAFLVAYDPGTDFTLKPWLETDVAHDPSAGQAIIGARIVVPGSGQALFLFGQPLQVVGQLQPTADRIDDTIFVNLATAETMIAWSRQQAEPELEAVSGTVSAVMVKVALGSDPHQVAVRILEQVPGVVPLETPNLFQTERRQMIGILRTLLGVLGMIWLLTLIFLGLVFSIAVNERRWEIGVLRAIGLPNALVFKALLTEGVALALVGGLAGAIGAIVVFAAFGEQIVHVARLPLQYPSPLGLIPVALGGQALAVLSVALAAVFPAWQISHEEVAKAMRE